MWFWVNLYNLCTLLWPQCDFASMVSFAVSKIFSIFISGNCECSVACQMIVHYAGCMQVSSEYLQSICNKLFSSHVRETADFSRPGTAGQLLRQSVASTVQPSSVFTVTLPLHYIASHCIISI